MDKTLDYYNSTAEEFIQGTINANVGNLYDLFLKYIPKGSYILDLGCGSGRDSNAFLKLGYNVLAIDGSEALCKFARKTLGDKVRCCNFSELDYENEFDGIWACASILHVPSNELPDILRNIEKAMKPNSYFYASFKYGEDEGYRNGRYFIDLTEDSFSKLLKDFNSLSIIETLITSDVRPGRENEKWLNVIVKKKTSV